MCIKLYIIIFPRGYFIPRIKVCSFFLSFFLLSPSLYSFQYFEKKYQREVVSVRAVAPSTSARISPRTTSIYELRRLSLVASLSGPSSVPFRSDSGPGALLPVHPRFVLPRRRSSRPRSDRNATRAQCGDYARRERSAFLHPRARPRNGIVHLSSSTPISAKNYGECNAKIETPRQRREIESHAGFGCDSIQPRLCRSSLFEV